jgi:hypothetical protein
MFKGGSLWQPPIMNPYSQGMPEELVGRPASSQHGGEPDPQDARNRGMLSERYPARRHRDLSMM